MPHTHRHLQDGIRPLTVPEFLPGAPHLPLEVHGGRVLEVRVRLLLRLLRGGMWLLREGGGAKRGRRRVRRGMRGLGVRDSRGDGMFDGFCLLCPVLGVVRVGLYCFLRMYILVWMTAAITAIYHDLRLHLC